jgi:hypothetical protein
MGMLLQGKLQWAQLEIEGVHSHVIRLPLVKPVAYLEKKVVSEETGQVVALQVSTFCLCD